jgi:extracellular elastinolytic metalloproteinase
LEYVIKPDHSAVLTYVVQIQHDEAGVWVEAFIDAHSGELISMNDFVAQATVSAT